MALGSLLLQLPAQRAPLDLTELPAWLRSYSEALSAPVLEIYSVPLLTDTSLLDAYVAAASEGDSAAPTTEVAPS